LDVFKQSVPSAYQVAVEMAGESPIRCSHQACVGIDSRRGIGGVSWSHDENELIFKRHGDGYGPDELLAWDFKTDQLRTVYRSNGRLSSYSKSGRCPIIKGHLVCVETGALTPPILVSVNLQTGVSSQLFAPNAALRQRVELRFGDLVERFFWEGPYGQLNGGWLVKPADYEAGATEALVITSYTCDGLLRGGTGETTPEFLLAERGILALCVQSPAPTTRAYDPSDFYGDEAFEPLRTYKETVERWRAVIDLLEQRGFADPQRIGISGLSSSANALQYAISHTSLFTAAVSATASDHDPWVHFFYPGEQYSGLIEHFRRTRGMPWPTEDKEGFFEAYSPALNADKIDTPLLIQSSDREFRLSLMQYAEMLRNDKVIEMFVFPDEGHQFLQPDHKRWVAERNVDWLSFWLTGDEDESFEKAAQYDRWRNMRADHCANMEADAKDLPDYCAAIVGE
jgi:dienelactone hydrolase